MPTTSNYTILQVLVITVIFLLAAIFLIVYVISYNNRKKRHIDEKKSLEEKFENELALSQMEVQEQTIRTVASDIHDNVGQLLSLTKLTLTSINLTEQPEKADHKLKSSVELLDKSIKELRQLTSVLHAQNFLDKGLDNALINEMNWISRSGQIHAEITIHEHKANILSSDQELFLFRIIQEILNNSIKHSKASIITIDYYLDKDRLYIKVHDNGIGFDLASTESKKSGLGLSNLKTRTKLINAMLTIESELGSGTTVIIYLPLKKDHEQERN